MFSACVPKSTDVGLADTDGVPAPFTSIENSPRPCVAATSVVPIQNSSSTATFAGPRCGTSHVEPPSWLVKTPTSVAAYSVFASCGSISRSLAGTFGSPVMSPPVASLHVAPPSVVFSTFPVPKPPVVTYTTFGSNGLMVMCVTKLPNVGAVTDANVGAEDVAFDDRYTLP